MPAPLADRLLGWFLRPWRKSQTADTADRKTRTSRTHVVILDGTLSTLERGKETHAGQVYRLLNNQRGVSIYYEAGLQWADWRSTTAILTGRGINAQIRRAYGFLASRYKPGDTVFLFGYSRGAFAVRSLAGAIDMIGLLQPEHATERNLRLAFRHYQCGPKTEAAKAFGRAYCHDSVPIEMIGVWDTVKALGLRLPLLWKLTEGKHAFHSHHLGPSIRSGYHALALNETRAVYTPEMWACPNWEARIEQVWFRGSHGDVGGHLSGFEPARPMANLSLVWMLEKASARGLPMPDRWVDSFETDETAPSSGTWRGWGKVFWARQSRIVGADQSERIHETVPVEMRARFDSSEL